MVTEPTSHPDEIFFKFFNISKPFASLNCRIRHSLVGFFHPTSDAKTQSSNGQVYGGCSRRGRREERSPVRSAFPTQEEVSEVLQALAAASDGLSVPQLLGQVNLSKGRIEKTIALLALESPAPIAKQGTKWLLAASTMSPSFWERAERLTELRRGKPNRLSKRIASITARTSREYFESESYRPHRSIRRDIVHQPYIDHLLSPSNNFDIRWDLSTALLADLADTHHCDLDKLRAKSRKAVDKAYDWIMRGDLSVALEAARDQKLPAHDRGDIARIVRNHARCFAVATAHTKIGLLRTHSTLPGGNRFSGFKTWCLLGQGPRH